MKKTDILKKLALAGIAVGSSQALSQSQEFMSINSLVEKIAMANSQAMKEQYTLDLSDMLRETLDQDSLGENCWSHAIPAVKDLCENLVMAIEQDTISMDEYMAVNGLLEVEYSASDPSSPLCGFTTLPPQ